MILILTDGDRRRRVKSRTSSSSVLARVLGRYDDAEEHFAKAAAKHDAMQAPFHQARTGLELGRMLLQRRGEGDLQRAIELQERSRHIAAQYGCAQVERRAVGLLASREA